MNDNVKAGGLVVLAMALISCNDAIIKTTSETLSIGQILLIRGIIACTIFVTAIKISRQPLLPRVAITSSNMIRATLETGATLCFVTGLSMLPIATASTLVWTSPLVLTVLAHLWLGEKVSGARWAAVILGFAGILLVTQPFGTAFSAAMVLPLLAAFLVAARDVVTRTLSAQIHSLHVTLTTLVFVTLAGAVLSWFDWRPVQPAHILALAVSACLLSTGFFTHITAVRKGELSYIAPFSFSGIVVALILGFVFWHDVPTSAMLMGIVLIVVACVYVIRSNRRPVPIIID